MKNYPFTPCYHPRRIINKYTGEEIEVSCGVCKACLLNRARKMTLLCQAEESEHKYCMFVNLTYADEYLPKAYPVYEEFSDTYRYYSDCERLGEKGQLLFTDECSKYRSGKSYLPVLLSKMKLGGYISYVSVRDCQNFIKRLRKNLSKYTNEKIRYYLVSEYGPKTFRAHYHAMFFYDEPVTQAYFSMALCKSWKFGRIDYSLSRGKCASYVAKYVNSNSFIPPILGNRSAKPFALHSTFFACGLYKSKKKEIYENGVDGFVRVGRMLGSQYVEFMPWRSLACTFFPRCKGYRGKSLDQLRYSYNLLRECKKAFGESYERLTLIQMCEKLLEYIYINDSDKTPPWMARYLWRSHNKHFRALACYFDKSMDYEYLEHPEHYLCLEDRDKVVHRMYSEMYISKHFLTFVCENPDDYGERERKLQMIVDYWKARDYENLKNWYHSMEEYSEEYPSSSLCFFYNNSVIDTERERLPAFVNFKVKTENDFEKSIKHRKLNEANGVLIGNL